MLGVDAGGSATLITIPTANDGPSVNRRLPEPATWAMLIAGFGRTGIMVWRRSDGIFLA